MFRRRVIDSFWLRIFYLFGALSIVTGLISIYSELYWLNLIPAALLFLYWSLFDFQNVYFLMLATIPLSIELSLVDGFSTDFPTEPLMGGIMFLYLAYVLSRPQEVDRSIFKHPLIFLIIIHYIWIWCSTLFSSDIFVSLKYSLAKTWYIIVFVFATLLFIKNENDFRKAFWCIFSTMMATILYTLARHARYGFSFESVNVQMLPFYRNHVNYACLITEMFPFVLLARTWYAKGSRARKWLNISALIILFAIYVAYTRSCWLALMAAALMYFIMKKKWTMPAISVGFTAIIAFFILMAFKGNYLNYAPNYQTTIYHSELNEHLQATFEGQDLSSEERIYRWIAGIRMWMQKPVTGYGPGNFVNFYRDYTVSSFRTYVSENPENSSIHNYFLLVLTEQGIIGLIIFLLLTFAIFYYAQKVYNETENRQEKLYVMAIALSLTIIYVNTFLSDLIETDKVGTFFFMNIALLVGQDLLNKRRKQSSLQNALDVKT